MSQHPVDRLIRSLLNDRRAAQTDEIRQILVRLAGAPFDPRLVSVTECSGVGSLADVTATTEQDIDQQLAWSQWQWERLPRVIDEIDTWDLIAQLAFGESWPIEEDRLARLAQQAAEGVLTPDQEQRYRGLRRVVDRNRPLIERLRNNS